MKRTNMTTNPGLSRTDVLKLAEWSQSGRVRVPLSRGTAYIRQDGSARITDHQGEELGHWTPGAGFVPTSTQSPGGSQPVRVAPAVVDVDADLDAMAARYREGKFA